MITGIALNRLWGVSTAAAGLFTAAAPRIASDLLCGPAAPPTAVVRILGLREAGQGIVLLARPRRSVATLFVAVDIIHAATMIAAVQVFPRYRQSEIVSAAAALASAALGLATARSLTRLRGRCR